jgi:hypothetical protein
MSLRNFDSADLGLKGIGSVCCKTLLASREELRWDCVTRSGRSHTNLGQRNCWHSPRYTQIVTSWLVTGLTS